MTAPGGHPCGRSVVSGETWRRAQPQTSSPPRARTKGTRCSGWSRVCGGDHRQGPRGHWGSDSSFLSLPKQTRAQPCSQGLSARTSRVFRALVGTRAEHCALSRILGSLAVHIGLGPQRPRHCPPFLGQFSWACQGRVGRGDPGSRDPFVALHQSRDLVCEQVRRGFTLSPPLP